MSTARSITLYIEPKTLKRLRLALKLYPQRVVDGNNRREMTADEFAEKMINGLLDEQFPLVKQMEKVLTQAERDFLAEHKAEEPIT